VDEETDYRHRDVDEQIRAAAGAFFDGTRQNTPPPGHWVSSLLSAVPEVQRLP
jgi:hypothetical protein